MREAPEPTIGISARTFQALGRESEWPAVEVHRRFIEAGRRQLYRSREKAAARVALRPAGPSRRSVEDGRAQLRGSAVARQVSRRDASNAPAITRITPTTDTAVTTSPRKMTPSARATTGIT